MDSTPNAAEREQAASLDEKKAFGILWTKKYEAKFDWVVHTLFYFGLIEQEKRRLAMLFLVDNAYAELARRLDKEAATAETSTQRPVNVQHAR